MGYILIVLEDMGSASEAHTLLKLKLSQTPKLVRIPITHL